MLKEIGLASGLLSSVFGMFNANKDKDTEAVSGSEEFGALMAGGIQVAQLPLAEPLSGSTEAKSVSGAKLSDSLGDGVQEALDMLREMTEGGLEGAMRWAMKELREDVMEGMGVSEEQLAAMDPAQREALEKQIAEEVQERMEQAMGKARNDFAAGEGKETSPVDIIAGLTKALQAEAKKAYREDTPIV